MVNPMQNAGAKQSSAQQQKFNSNNPNFKALLETVSKKIGVPPEQLRAELEAGKFDSALKSMNSQEAAKFQQVLKNPKLMDQLMSSSQAQALYQKLTGQQHKR